jgi:hypothetical protein
MKKRFWLGCSHRFASFDPEANFDSFSIDQPSKITTIFGRKVVARHIFSWGWRQSVS